MTILIKGMEMPRAGQRTVPLVIYPNGKVELIYPNGKVEFCYDDVFNTRKIHEDLEAVEIPPHGRLIDADELDKRIEEGGCCCTEEYAEWMGVCIGTAPTIIEAEE